MLEAEDSLCSSRDSAEETATAKRWLDWCRSHQFVKCTEFDVPEGILPRNYSGIIIDVKVHGTKRWGGPDDKIYSMYEDLRQKVARGNCVLELHQKKNGVIISTSYLFVVFALKKFSGGMGDEDEDSKNMCQNMWQNYFIQPVSSAVRVVCTTKANGEAAHVSSRQIANLDFFCIGSKNVHMLVRNIGDVEKYKDGRFMIAKVVAVAFFTHFMENEKVEQTKKVSLIQHLQTTKYTAVLEVLQPDYQHVENISYLTSPELRFICWTKPFGEENCDSLCAIAPNLAIERAREFGLQTVEYDIISASEAEDYMTTIRAEKGYEGKVLYFMDKSDNVLGIIKKKTAWYIILRAIREKACSACSPRSTQDKLQIKKKISNRILEIQSWLGFSNVYCQNWTALAIAFVEWIIRLVKRNPSVHVNTAIRSRFPILWKEFLDSHEEYKQIFDDLNYNSSLILSNSCPSLATS